MLRSARSVSSVARTSISASECHVARPTEVMPNVPAAAMAVFAAELRLRAASDVTSSPAASMAWILVPSSSNVLSIMTCPVPSG